MFTSAPHRSDGDLLFLTDSAYFSLLDHDRTLGRSSKGKQKQDGLFLERLDSFIEGQLKEVEAFASREQRMLDEIRKLVAIPHAKFLFSKDPTLPSSRGDTSATSLQSTPSVRNTLSNMSSTLQVLHSTTGLDSVLLVVSPMSAPSAANISTPSIESPSPNVSPDETPEASWIGGTELGKEFWMGLKGGGLNGARAFRIKCQMRHEAEVQAKELEASTSMTSPVLSQPGPPSLTEPSGTRSSKVKSVKSGDIKTELNAMMRQALRSVSGNPSAEMRWTKPAALEDSYNVRLVGWPSAVEMRNPSNNSVKDNRLLLDLVRSGGMKFVKRESLEWNCMSSAAQQMNDTPQDRRLQEIASPPEGGNPAHTSRIRKTDGVEVSSNPETSLDSAPLTTSIGLDPTSHGSSSLGVERTFASPVTGQQLFTKDNSPQIGDYASERESTKRVAEGSDEELDGQDRRKRQRPSPGDGYG